MRQRKKKFYPRAVKEVAWVIRLLLNCHSSALHVLLGKAPFPSTEELAEMMRYVGGTAAGREELGTVIQMSRGLSQVELAIEAADFVRDIIEQAGGWDRFVEVFQHCSRSGSENYKILTDHTRWIRMGRPMAGHRSATYRLAEKYHFHPDTLRRRCNDLVLTLAEEILYPPEEIEVRVLESDVA